MGIPGAMRLYQLLCDVMHPARGSVHYLLTKDLAAGTTHVLADTDDAQIAPFVKTHRRTLVKLIEPGFTPSLLILRVLHQFKIFPAMPRLRSIDFTGLPIWARIEKAQRR